MVELTIKPYERQLNKRYGTQDDRFKYLGLYIGPYLLTTRHDNTDGRNDLQQIKYLLELWKKEEPNNA